MSETVKSKQDLQFFRFFQNCPSGNFLSCRAAILVLFYLVTPLHTDDLVTGHLHGTTLCTMFC